MKDTKLILLGLILAILIGIFSQLQTMNNNQQKIINNQNTQISWQQKQFIIEICGGKGGVLKGQDITCSPSLKE